MTLQAGIIEEHISDTASVEHREPQHEGREYTKISTDRLDMYISDVAALHADKMNAAVRTCAIC